MKDKKVTYEQIAKESGISLATISRVINKSPYVTEKTRAKVINAMEHSGIDTSHLDLSPVSSDNMIIFNVPTLSNPFYSPIAIAARITANRHGYSLLVNEDPINTDTIESFLRLIKKTRAVGLICANSISHERLLRLSMEIPTVCCCESVSNSPVPFVTIDDEVAAINATRHLLSLGKKRIAMINGPTSFKYARDRYKGYEYALSNAGIDVDKSLVSEIGADMDFDQAKAICLHMLNGSNPPDSFFCISDVIASAAVKAAFECSKKIPDDVAVVGFDDIIISKIMNPTITTVKQPTSQIGLLATEMLIKRIEKDEASVDSVYLGTELIIRESTTPS